MTNLTSKGLRLDNNQFLIYNKKYPFARITPSKGNVKEVVTTELELAPEQLWTLKPDPNKSGAYYIVNEAQPMRRLQDSGTPNELGQGQRYLWTTDKIHDKFQLFNFVPSGDDDECFYIRGVGNARIMKFGPNNNETYVYTFEPIGERDNELWKLVPRFKANFYTNTVFHFDNRENPEKIIRKVSVTTGLRRSSTSAISKKDTFKLSMGVSLEAGCEFFKISASLKEEFSNAFETSFSAKTEEEWSKTEEVTFTIPANKNFKVMQHVVKFDGEFEDDPCTLLTDTKVFVSKRREFDDPDNFIINKTQ